MRKILSALLMISVFLTGCTSSNSTENSSDSAETQPSTTAETQSSTSDYYFEFPSWYELDKVVVNENMVCYSRSKYFGSEDSGFLPFVWLYVFDDDGHMTDYKGWLLCNDEKSAQEIFDKHYSGKYHSYVEKNNIAVTYDVNLFSFSIIAEKKGYSSVDEISMLDVIDFCDGGTLWGKEPRCEVVYFT